MEVRSTEGCISTEGLRSTNTVKNAELALKLRSDSLIGFMEAVKSLMKPFCRDISCMF